MTTSRWWRELKKLKAMVNVSTTATLQSKCATSLNLSQTKVSAFQSLWHFSGDSSIMYSLMDPTESKIQSQTNLTCKTNRNTFDLMLQDGAQSKPTVDPPGLRLQHKRGQWGGGLDALLFFLLHTNIWTRYYLHTSCALFFFILNTYFWTHYYPNDPYLKLYTFYVDALSILLVSNIFICFDTL